MTSPEPTNGVLCLGSVDFRCVFSYTDAPGSFNILCSNLFAMAIVKDFKNYMDKNLHSIKYLHYTDVYPPPEVTTFVSFICINPRLYMMHNERW